MSFTRSLAASSGQCSNLERGFNGHRFHSRHGTAADAAARRWPARLILLALTEQRSRLIRIATLSGNPDKFHRDPRTHSCFEEIARCNDRRKPRRLRNTLGLRANVKNPALSRGGSDSCLDGVRMEPGSRSLMDQHAFARLVCCSGEVCRRELRHSGDNRVRFGRQDCIPSDRPPGACVTRRTMPS